MQNQDHNVPAPQPEALSATTGLKGKLKSLFNLKSLKGLPTAAWKNFKHEVKNRKAEMVFGFLTSGVIKGGAATLCTASLLGSASGIIMMGAATGAAVAAVKYGISCGKASEEFSLKQLGLKMAFGATFGILGNTVGSLIGQQIHCFGGKLFDGKSFITTHKSNLLPSLEGQASHAAPSALHNMPSVSEMAGAHPAPPVATPAPDVVVSAPVPATPDVTTAPSVPDTVISAAPAPVAPVAPATPLDSIKEYAAHHNVSTKLKDALARADSGNAQIRAQALDDIAVYAPKGMRVEAYELLKNSADMGNLKAKTDMAEILFNGDKTLGVKADENAAIATMRELAKHSQRASRILESWIGNPPPESVRELVRQAHEAAAANVAPAPAPNIVTPDVTTPDVPAVPVQVEAPDAASAIEVGGPIADQSVTATPLPDATPAAPAPAVEPDCKVSIDITDPSQMIMECADNGADLGLRVGDTVTVARPVLINMMQPR